MVAIFTKFSLFYSRQYCSHVLFSQFCLILMLILLVFLLLLLSESLFISTCCIFWFRVLFYFYFRCWCLISENIGTEKSFDVLYSVFESPVNIDISFVTFISTWEVSTSTDPDKIKTVEDGYKSKKKQEKRCLYNLKCIFVIICIFSNLWNQWLWKKC